MDIRLNLRGLPLVLMMALAIGCQSLRGDRSGEQQASEYSESAPPATVDEVENLAGAGSGQSENHPASEQVTLASHQADSHNHPVAPKRYPTIRDLESAGEFSQILEATSGIVLVDFYAEWCGPCRKQSSVLHEIEGVAAEADAQIVKVDVDEYPELARKYQVSSLPTLVVLQDSEVVQRKVGLTRRSQLVSMLR